MSVDDWLASCGASLYTHTYAMGTDLNLSGLCGWGGAGGRKSQGYDEKIIQD